MKIEKVQNPYGKPSFNAGKVRVFSDFDKTFLPSSHKNFVKNYDIRFVNAIRENFKSFKEFLNNTREGLKFTITTGRTFGEFLTMAEVARERKFGMPLPDTLIVKNGSDEHLKLATDENFYNGGEFPFKYEITNKVKEAKIKEISGWDGPKFKKIIENILKSYDFRIIEADSENSVSDYGPRSMFSQGKIPYEVGKIFYGTDKADWSVGMRKDGNLKIFFTIPADMFDVEERRIAYHDIQTKIYKKALAEGIEYTQGDGPDMINGRSCLSYVPEIPKNTDNHKLTKFYDTYEAFQEAKKNNDLVIVAGDSSNDLEMLNPAYYLEYSLVEKMIKKYGDGTFRGAMSNPSFFIKILDKEPELTEYFIKMPFRGVIVRQNDGKNNLQELEPFTHGKYQKIIIVDEGELQCGIKESIKAYCKQNPKYEEKLSADVKKQIKTENHKKPPRNNDVNGGGGDDGEDSP